MGTHSTESDVRPDLGGGAYVAISGLEMESEPLLFGADVADVGYMSDGTLRSVDTYGELAAQAAALEHTVTKRPAKLRIAATVGADTLGILVASSLAVWVADALIGVPVVERLVSPFSEIMGGSVLMFVALVPYWLAALWAFGLYRSPVVASAAPT